MQETMEKRANRTVGKSRQKDFFAVLLFFFLLPYTCSSVVRAGQEKTVETIVPVSGRTVRMQSGSDVRTMTEEAFLIGALAAVIPAEYEPEALKAQAVIARTYIRRQMGEEKEISELSLDLDRKPREELKKIWGKTEFPEKYSRLEEAVIQTNRIVMTYDGEMIAPLFCAVTAGSTRDGDEGYPYLKSVSCPDDEKAADFISFVSLSAKQAAAALNEIPGKEGEVRQVRPEAFPGKVQTVKRDTAGYVQEIQIDECSFTGEEAAGAFGLSSSCFFTEPQENGIGITVKGKGHGYGLSQNEAEAKAEDGWDFKEILEYFYSGIAFFTE